jgi:membrane-associated protease RseP (regulator of RpoE activity)
VNLLGWVIFIVALLFSVMLHETGHFVTAKKFGMKATRYFIGFGPTIWSKQRGETEYGIKALPLGGFVKIIGMTSIDEVDPEDEARSFRRAPAWQRLIVLAAGSFMHFVLAFVLIFGLALGIGIENDNTSQLGTVAACVPATSQALNNDSPCTSSDAVSPAKMAGLRVGDKVTSFDGTKVSSWNQLADGIKNAHAGEPVTLTVLRDGQQVTLHTTLATVKGRSGGYLGIAPAVVFQSAGPIGAISYTGSAFAQTLSGSVKALGSLPSDITKAFSHKAASSGNTPISVVGAAEITGQAVAANVGWQYKVSFVLLLIASINIFVGALNLLPLLPMDGGHIAAVAYESIRSRIARWRKRPSPGLVDYRKIVPVSFSIFMIVVFFGVLLLLANIVNPVSIG